NLINPLVAKALAEKPPRTLAEVAERYSVLLNAVEKRWHDYREEEALAGSSPPMTMPDAAEEELRQGFHGADGPATLFRGEISDLELLPDRPSEGKLRELRKAVERWRATGRGAPPRAMALEDAAVPYEPHVFRRGNPNHVGEGVPRQFLQV